MIGLLYATGTRLSECLKLWVKDLDYFAYRRITVRDGKGEQEDRVITVLPEKLVSPLELHSLSRPERYTNETSRRDSGRSKCPMR